jgi:hypothetical protein
MHSGCGTEPRRFDLRDLAHFGWNCVLYNSIFYALSKTKLQKHNSIIDWEDFR